MAHHVAYSTHSPRRRRAEHAPPHALTLSSQHPTPQGKHAGTSHLPSTSPDSHLLSSPPCSDPALPESTSSAPDRIAASQHKHVRQSQTEREKLDSKIDGKRGRTPGTQQKEGIANLMLLTAPLGCCRSAPDGVHLRGNCCACVVGQRIPASGGKDAERKRKGFRCWGFKGRREGEMVGLEGGCFVDARACARARVGAVRALAAAGAPALARASPHTLPLLIADKAPCSLPPRSLPLSSLPPFPPCPPLSLLPPPCLPSACCLPASAAPLTVCGARVAVAARLAPTPPLSAPHTPSPLCTPRPLSLIHI